MPWKYGAFFCTLLACPIRLIAKDAPVSPELVRSAVYHRLEGGPSGEIKFLTVIVSTPANTRLGGDLRAAASLGGPPPGPIFVGKSGKPNRPGLADATAWAASSVLARIVVHFGGLFARWSPRVQREYGPENARSALLKLFRASFPASRRGPRETLSG